MLKVPAVGWAIVDAVTGKLVLFDARVPVFWNRRVAKNTATEHGWARDGGKAPIRICRVSLRQYSGTKK